jgi:hypothetical protein
LRSDASSTVNALPSRARVRARVSARSVFTMTPP